MVVEACLEGLEILAEAIKEPCRRPKRDREFERVLDTALQNPEFRREFERQGYMASFDANHTAFEVKKSRLIEKYPGKFVVIHKGVPVLIGDNLLEVDEEFLKQYGKEQPGYIGFLGDLPAIAMPGFEVLN